MSYDFTPRGKDESPIHEDVVYEYEQFPEDKTEKDLERHVAPAIRAHMKDFLGCIASRGKPVADIEEGYMSAAACILANLSLQLGRSLQWDHAKGIVVGDAEANSCCAARIGRRGHPDPAKRVNGGQMRTNVQEARSAARWQALAVTAVLVAATGVGAAQAPLPQLKVSDNKRFLVAADGRPFFWLGDTAWELFHRATREEAERYLKKRGPAIHGHPGGRAREFDGLSAPNAYGHTPLRNNDPTQPNEDYFSHVDWVVAKANALGLHVGFLPTWGDKWNKRHGAGPEIFTPDNARQHGEWLGRRYKNAGVIWIVGGDRPVETDAHREIVRAMARGLRTGDGGAHLITFHPSGGNSSSTPFHDDEWLDFNMRQNGHVAEFTGRYDQTRADYNRTPTKPVLDGEPIYETIPFRSTRRSWATRLPPTSGGRCLGSFLRGFRTYLRASFRLADVDARSQADQQPALAVGGGDRPGGRRANAARARAHRIAAVSHPRADRDHRDGQRPDERARVRPGYQFVAMRAGTYAMVYAPVGRPFAVKMSVIAGPKGESVVVQSAHRRGGGARHLRQHRRADVHAAGSRRAAGLGARPGRRFEEVLHDQALGCRGTKVARYAVFDRSVRASDHAAAPNTSTFATMTG